jgi:hypothetical protein
VRRGLATPFRGQPVPQEPTDEPALALVERTMTVLMEPLLLICDYDPVRALRRA